jgi:hypothetical protein
MRLLYAALPNDGIPTGVKDRKHDHSCGFDTKEYRVGEATRPNATDVAVHNWETLRVVCDQAKSTFYLCGELCAETNTALLVPDCGIVELAPRCTPKDDRTSHRLRRSAIDVFTSSQETTSFGFAS